MIVACKFVVGRHHGLFHPFLSQGCGCHSLQIQESYKAATGHHPYIFEGSSMGAGQFGFLRVHRRNKS